MKSGEQQQVFSKGKAMVRGTRWVVTAAVLWLFCSTSARAYVDLAPTLGRIVRESRTITVVEVDRFSAEKGVVVLKRVRDLKGESGEEVMKHQVVRADEP